MICLPILGGLKDMLKINELTPEILHFQFDESEDMFKHFLRFSEWYESANKKLFRKDFTLPQALTEYRKTKGMDYTSQVGAYNLPVKELKEASTILTNLSAEEEYILDTIKFVDRKNPGNLKYLIATEDRSDMAHEIAHSLYLVDEFYRDQMNYLIDDLPIKVRDAMINFLKAELYNEIVYKDEFQAYMATGLAEMPHINTLHRYRAPFIDVFLERAREHDLQLWTKDE